MKEAKIGKLKLTQIHIVMFITALSTIAKGENNPHVQ